MLSYFCPILTAYPSLSLQRPLSGVTAVYLLMASIDRAKKTEQQEQRPDMRTYAARYTGLDSMLRGWAGLITVPSILVGGLSEQLVSFAKAQGEAGKLSARAVRFLPPVMSFAALAGILPASKWIADQVMDWAVSPLLLQVLEPPATAAPTGDYVPLPPESILEAEADKFAAATVAMAAAAAGAAAKAAGDGSSPPPPPSLSPAELATMMFDFPGAKLTEDEKVQLAWAMDGDPSTPYPHLSLESALKAGVGRGKAAGGQATAAAVPPPAGVAAPSRPPLA